MMQDHKQIRSVLDYAKIRGVLNAAVGWNNGNTTLTGRTPFWRGDDTLYLEQVLSECQATGSGVVVEGAVFRSRTFKVPAHFPEDLSVASLTVELRKGSAVLDPKSGETLVFWTELGLDKVLFYALASRKVRACARKDIQTWLVLRDAKGRTLRLRERLPEKQWFFGTTQALSGLSEALPVTPRRVQDWLVNTADTLLVVREASRNDLSRFAFDSDVELKTLRVEDYVTTLDDERVVPKCAFHGLVPC